MIDYEKFWSKIYDVIMKSILRQREGKKKYILFSIIFKGDNKKANVFNFDIITFYFQFSSVQGLKILYR